MTAQQQQAEQVKDQRQSKTAPEYWAAGGRLVY
jgi:hypothetical protein